MKALEANYSDAVDGLNQLGPIICSLIEESLREAGIQIHSVTHRVKDVESASKKLSLHPEKYKSLNDLTDLLGIRIITYFPRDVDKVAEVLSKEFIIDPANSVDKRRLLEPDRFGYLSLHYMASLTPSRSHLVEYRRYTGAKFEIQIRSILQHAWAEIEHDLGYKTVGSLPHGIRRSFSQLAGLLELADEEFERIRDKIGEYDKHVSETISVAPQTLMIDQSSLMAAVVKEKALIDLDKVVVATGSGSLLAKIEPSYIGEEASQLKALGIKDLDQLLKTARAQKKHVEIFARIWLKQDTSTEPGFFYKGVGLSYLGYVLAAQTSDERLVKWNISLRKKFPSILNEVRNTWEQVLKELGETVD